MPRDRKRRAPLPPAMIAVASEAPATSRFASWSPGRKHMLVLDLESGQVTRAAVTARYGCSETDIDAAVKSYGRNSRVGAGERAA